MFDAQREFIVLASTCQKPSQVSTGKIIFISSGESCFECFYLYNMNFTLLGSGLFCFVCLFVCFFNKSCSFHDQKLQTIRDYAVSPCLRLANELGNFQNDSAPDFPDIKSRSW